MKVITLEEFKDLVNKDGWKHTQKVEILDSIVYSEYQWDEETDTSDIVCVQHYYGGAEIESTLDDIKIIYMEGFNYVKGRPDSFETGIEGMDEPFIIDGIKVIDENGDEVDIADLIEYLNDDFTTIDYSGLDLNKDQVLLLQQ